MTGKVYLVGAGPGDAGLMTLKGWKVLKEADVIVYDNLASDALLNETKNGAEWVDAGKIAGHHKMKQEEIGQLLVAKAKEGHLVVRLKGGDPFIFGRGGEEALVLAKAGIDFEVIPGVSSSYAAAAYCGIPVTHRHVASSFHVITGHEDPLKGQSVLDYEVLAKEEGTLVFLMGLSRIRMIADALIAHGKNSQTPAAVISSGTTARQRCVTAALGTMADVAEAAHITPPAIFLVGEVVQLQSEIAWQKEKPLSGKRILITATGEIAGRLQTKIETLGGEAVPLSLIEIAPLDDVCLKDRLLQAKEDAWLVFTSRNGVNVFFDRMRKEKVDVRVLGGKRMAVIGRGTKETLAAHGYYADLMPKQSCSEALAEALCVQADSDILLFRAKEASPVLTEKLEKAGIHAIDTALYETKIQEQKKTILQRILTDIDIVTFCSASAVHAFAAMTDGIFDAEKAVYIGPVTAAAAKVHGFCHGMVADRFDLDGLMDAIAAYVGKRGI